MDDTGAVQPQWQHQPPGLVLVRAVNPVEAWRRFVAARTAAQWARFVNRFGPLHPDPDNGAPLPLDDYAAWAGWHRAMRDLSRHAQQGTQSLVPLRPLAQRIEAMIDVRWSERIAAVHDYLGLAAEWWIGQGVARRLETFARRCVEAGARHADAWRRVRTMSAQAGDVWPAVEVSKHLVGGGATYRLVPREPGAWDVLGLGLLAVLNGSELGGRTCRTPLCDTWIPAPSERGRPRLYCEACAEEGEKRARNRLHVRRHRSKHKRPASG